MPSPVSPRRDPKDPVFHRARAGSELDEQRNRCLPSLYARTFGVVRSRTLLAIAIVVGSSMHAAGHAFLAAVAGGLTRLLAGGGPPMDARSSALLPVGGIGDGALTLAIAGVFAATAKLVGGALASWGEARVAGAVASRLRLEVLDRLLDVHSSKALRAPRHDDHGGDAFGTKGEGVAALTTHVHEVEHGVAHGVLGEARALVALVPLIALLVWLAPRLATTAGLALLAFGVFAFVLRRAFKRAHARAARDATKLVAAADEAVEHAELWATYGAKEKIRSHVSTIGRVLVHEAAKLRVRASLLSSTSEVLGALALVLTLALVSSNTLSGVDRGTIVPFAIAFFMAYKPLRDLVDARLAKSRGEAALAAATREERETVASEEPETKGVRWSLEPLVLDNLVTQHGSKEPITRTIAPGSVVAIVGPTGAGKTTLLRTLLGIEAPASGSIRYGDVTLDARGVGPSERPFAWVPQHAPVIGDTLAANVALGGEGDATRILEELGAKRLARELGDAVLGTVRSVSGGERQWIAMARALATSLPVLLFDEPTSGLDAASQALLLEAIAKLRGKHTILIVTHRAEPLAICDAVISIGGRHEIDLRPGDDADLSRAEKLAVEDVRVLGREAQERLARERVDPRSE